MSVPGDAYFVGKHAVSNIPDWPRLTWTPYDDSTIELSVHPKGFVQAPPADPIVQVYGIDANGHSTDSRSGGKGLDGAACGSSSVAAELGRYGYFATTESVDGHMRQRMNMGGSIWGANDYMRRRGLQVEQRFGGDWEDLRVALKQGFGVIVSFAHEATDHTVVVTGMYTNDDGKEFIQFQEWRPDIKGTPGQLYAISKERFLRNWDDMRLDGLNGLHLGIYRAYTLIGPKDCAFPPPQQPLATMFGEIKAAMPLSLLDAFHQVGISFHYFGEGEVLGGAARFLSGFIEGAVQLPAAIPYAAGSALDWVASKAFDWSLSTVKAGPWWKSVLACFPLALTAIGVAAGWLLRQVGHWVGFVTSLFARMLSLPFRALADWARDDNDAVEATRYANKDGTVREIENWQRLRKTPVEPGKTQLIESMLSGHVSDEERKMVVRVIQATLDDKGCVTEDTRKLVARIGEKRLNESLGDVAAWSAIRASLRPPKQNLPIQALKSPAA